MARETKLRARRAVCAALLFACSAVSLWPDPQGGLVGTITAGTAIPVIPSRKTVGSVLVNSVFFEATDCATTCGMIYVLSCNPQVTCVKGGAGTTYLCEIAAATSTSPGGWCRFPTNGSATNSSGGTDLRYYALDGAATGTPFLVSWDVRN